MRTDVVTTMALVMLALLMAVSASSYAESDDEVALRHLKEELWPKAYREQDVALLDSILAEEFRLIDAQGNWSTKSDELEYISQNAPGYDSLVFTIRRLDVFENGIVAGQGNMTGSDADGAYTMTYQSTNVLIKRDGRWKAIASHVSGIKREPARRESTAPGQRAIGPATGPTAPVMMPVWTERQRMTISRHADTAGPYERYAE